MAHNEDHSKVTFTNIDPTDNAQLNMMNYVPQDPCPCGRGSRKCPGEALRLR